MNPVILTSNFQAPIERLSSFQYRFVRNFNPDVPPSHPANIEAA